MIRFILPLFSLLCLVGCAPRYVDFFPCHDDGTLKPHVAFLPTIDSCHPDLCWDVSEEITQGARFHAMSHGRLFLFSPEQVNEWISRCPSTNFCGQDLSFTGQFKEADYIVISELVEHRLQPYDRGKIVESVDSDSSCNLLLQMKLRLRIIDTRCQEPRIVRQEIINSHFLISKVRVDYTREGWGTPKYLSTPYGMAHQRLICELVDRMEELSSLGR